MVKEIKKIIRIILLGIIIIGAAVFFKEPQRRQKLFSFIVSSDVARADAPAPVYVDYSGIGCGCSSGGCCL